MRKFTITIFIGLCWLTSLAQKIPLTISDLENWPSIISPNISNDGKYIFYTHSFNGYSGDSITVKAISGNWERTISNCFSPTFCDNGKQFVCLKNDSLLIQFTGSSLIKKLPMIASYQLGRINKEEYILFSKNNSDSLFIYRMKDGNIISFSNVIDYTVNPLGNSIALSQYNTLKGKKNFYVNMIGSKLRKGKQIFQGGKVTSLSFDKSGSQLAFLIQHGSGEKNHFNLGYYQSKQACATEISTRSSLESFENMKIVGDNFPGIYFSDDGKCLFFGLKYSNVPIKRKNSVIMQIMKYDNPFLDSDRKITENLSKIYLASLNLKSKMIHRLEYENDWTLPLAGKKNNYLIVRNVEADINETWNTKNKPSTYLVETTTGLRKLLFKGDDDNRTAWCISPDSKYLIYYQQNKNGGDYYSYEISNEVIRNISTRVSTNWGDQYNDNLYTKLSGTIGCIGWIDGSRYVLINDRYDIWKIDPLGIKRPVNITNGYGKANQIILYPAFNILDAPLTSNGDILLKAFNLRDKTNGFFSLSMRKKSSLQLLTMGSYLYGSANGIHDLYKPCNDLKKAENADIYIIKRESCRESPNIFYTTNFKKFKQLTWIAPEKETNWIKSELINYTLPDGRPSQGILYKPENFNEKHRYPVIFNYYFFDKRSNSLNSYLRPELSNSANINIPYYVSNGYLVFVPDITRNINSTDKLKESSIFSVVAARNYLVGKNWIDSAKIGLNGHSQGGLQTNYIVTNTNIFAAAVSGAGNSDLVSLIGSLRGGSTSQISTTENGVLYGTPLSDQPEEYIKYSPIFFAKNVTTPILLLHNKGDKGVSFSQGFEFFQALRRLGKKVWLINYNNEGHLILDTSAQLDFTLRMKQFYDYYLKNGQEPCWMQKESN